MYTLFGTEGSGAAAIEMALSLCEAPYTLTNACSWEEGPGKEALEHVNPLLQVPRWFYRMATSSPRALPS